LRLPSGNFDVPIMFFDPAFDPEFEPVFDVFNTDGVLGDKFTANGIIQPQNSPSSSAATACGCSTSARRVV